MSYLAITRLNAILPPQFLTEALDDNGDGAQDAGLFDEILAAVSAEIDGLLGQRYAVPFADPVPAIVEDAATKLCAEALYLRRGLTGDKNPWTAAATASRAVLGDIAAGRRPLTPALAREKPSVSAITETARTYPVSGRIAV